MHTINTEYEFETIQLDLREKCELSRRDCWKVMIS